MRILCFCTLFVLCGCTTFLSYTNPAMQIQKGMDSNAVAKLMGEPQYRSFIDNSEEWVYERSTVTNVETKVIVVTFVNSKVVELNSFPQIKPTIQQPSVVVTPPVYIDTNRPHYPNNKIVAMDNAAFQSLYNNVKAKPFKDDKLELLKIGVSNRYLTCTQCSKLMSLFSFDDEKMSIVRIVAPRIIDRENFTQIIDSLSFLSNKTEAKKLMSRN